MLADRKALLMLKVKRRLFEVRVLQVCLPEIATREIGVLEIGAPEMSVSEIGFPEVGPREVDGSDSRARFDIALVDRIVRPQINHTLSTDASLLNPVGQVHVSTIGLVTHSRPVLANAGQCHVARLPGLPPNV